MSSVLALGLLWLVRADLMTLAVLLVVVSKWQMFIGGPRLWLHNLRDNAVDLTVLASILAMLNFYSDYPTVEVIIIGFYLFWQLVIKPMGGVSGRGIQALTALVLGINILFLYSLTIGLAGVVVGTWALSLVAADHYLILQTENPTRRLLTTVWGLVAVELAWILGMWNVIYRFAGGRFLLVQASVVIAAVAYLFGVIYYEHTQKSLSKKRLNLYLSLLAFLVLGIIIGSEWISRV